MPLFKKRRFAGFGDVIGPVTRFQNNWFRQNSDGLGKVPGFLAALDRAIALSGEVDGFRGEPLAADTVRLMDAQANAINATLDEAARLYEWDGVFGRSKNRQRDLDNALQTASDQVNQFLAQVGGALEATKKAISDRAAAIAAQQKAAADAEAARKQAEAAAAAAQAAQAQQVQAAAQAEATKSQAAAQQTAVQAALDQLTAQKQIVKLQEPTIFGLSYPVAGLIGLAVVGGGALLLRRR